jgi:hypothetical protein
MSRVDSAFFHIFPTIFKRLPKFWVLPHTQWLFTAEQLDRITQFLYGQGAPDEIFRLVSSSRLKKIDFFFGGLCLSTTVDPLTILRSYKDLYGLVPTYDSDRTFATISNMVGSG